MTQRSLLFGVKGLVLVSCVVAPRAAAAQDACQGLTSASLPRATIVAATSVPANATTKAPAFCEVRATLSPAPGSQIGAVYRLPVDWNGKVLGVGGGGSAGNVTLQGAVEGLSRGYAVIQNEVLPGLAWVEIEAPAVKVDRRREVLRVAEARGRALDAHDLAVEAFGHAVGDRVLHEPQDAIEMPVNHARHLLHRLQA